jgi:hypothetical protein
MFLKHALYSDRHCGCLNITKVCSINMYIFCFYNNCIFNNFCQKVCYCNKRLIQNMNSGNYLFLPYVIAPVIKIC